MNKEYWDYYFSKKKKLTDRAFKLRIAMLMCSMVACAAIMASSAFALFEHNINSETKLTAVTFALQTAERSSTGNVFWNVTDEGDSKRLTITGPAGVRGYCKIAITNPQEVTTWYYTPAFSGEYSTLITVPAEWVVSVVDATWGYPAVDAEFIIGGSLIISEPEEQQTSEAADIKLTSPRPTVTDDNNEENETDNTTEQNDTTESDNTTEQTEAATTPAVTEKETTTTVPESSGNETTETPAADTGSSDSSATTTESTPVVSSGENGTGNSGSSENTASSDTGSASSGSSDSGSSSAASSPVATAPSGGESSSVSDGGGE